MQQGVSLKFKHREIRLINNRLHVHIKVDCMNNGVLRNLTEKRMIATEAPLDGSQQVLDGKLVCAKNDAVIMQVTQNPAGKTQRQRSLIISLPVIKRANVLLVMISRRRIEFRRAMRSTNKLPNLLFLWIMRPLMQHLSAYTRRTKPLARNAK